jgi:hypothetical protein
MAINIAAANHQVCRVIPQHSQHFGEQRFVMLTIGIDDRNELRPAGHYAIKYGAGEAPFANAMNAAHAWVGHGDGIYESSGSIRRIIVDHYQLPGDSRQGDRDALDQRCYVCPLIEGGHNHGKNWQGWRRKVQWPWSLL